MNREASTSFEVCGVPLSCFSNLMWVLLVNVAFFGWRYLISVLFLDPFVWFLVNEIFISCHFFNLFLAFFIAKQLISFWLSTLLWHLVISLGVTMCMNPLDSSSCGNSHSTFPFKVPLFRPRLVPRLACLHTENRGQREIKAFINFPNALTN